MRARVLHLLPPILGAALFGAALLVLRRELAHVHWRSVSAGFASLPFARVALAVALTATSYLFLSAYDFLGLHWVGHRIATRRVLFTSFVSYAFSNNVGLSLFGSTAVRLRMYTSSGLAAAEVLRLVAFVGITCWLGILTLAGAAFTIHSPLTPQTWPPTLRALPSIAPLLILPVVAWILTCTLRKRPLAIRNLEVRLPSPGVAVAQTLVGVVDWLLAAAVFFALLPAVGGLGFPLVLTTFLLGQTAGLVSHVPGGLGVFEAVAVVLLSPILRVEQILGALLAFRVVYYLLPLLAGILLVAGHEAYRHRRFLGAATALYQRAAGAVAPPLFAVATFAAGTLLLLSGALPDHGGPLDWLRIAELPVLELTHLLGSLLGVGLLLLARGIGRRLDAAFWLAIAMLGTGAALSLVRGNTLPEAAALLLLLAALLPCRREFRRRAHLFARRLSLPWTVAVLLAVAGSVTLGLFAHRHVEYSMELWWNFDLRGDTSRFLRASAGAAAAIVAVALARLIRPAAPVAQPAADEELDAIEPAVRQSPQTRAFLALLGDKQLLVNRDRSAFIMYRVQGRTWLTMGNPVGPEEEWDELLWGFRELAEEHDGQTVFYGVDAPSLFHYLDLGMAFLKLGERARVPLDGFSVDGDAGGVLRRDARQAGNAGATFAVAPAEDVAGLLPDLRRVSDEWLEAKRARERGFSTGFFREDYLRRTPVGLVRHGGRVVAFANVLTGAGQAELSVDITRHSADAPPGCMAFLFAGLMQWGAAAGYRWFDLGLAPLSGLRDGPASPLWSQLAAGVYRFGGRFHRFAGLRGFMERFGPVWTPEYVAFPDLLGLPRTIADIVDLVSENPAEAVRVEEVEP